VNTLSEILRSIAMKLVGVLLLLTGLTITLTLRFSPVMGSNNVKPVNREKASFNDDVVPVQWAPAVGSILIVAGAATVIAGRRRRRSVTRPTVRIVKTDRSPHRLKVNNPSGILYARKDSVH
jgi:hypothetical protein